MRMREAVFATSPYCLVCEGNGVVRFATEVDHIIPLHLGGSNDPSNLQPICRRCHAEKTEREKQSRDIPPDRLAWIIRRKQRLRKHQNVD